MTYTHPIYAILTFYGVGIFGLAFIVEMLASLRDHRWNVIKTLVDFIRDF